LLATVDALGVKFKEALTNHRYLATSGRATIGELGGHGRGLLVRFRLSGNSGDESMTSTSGVMVRSRLRGCLKRVARQGEHDD